MLTFLAVSIVLLLVACCLFGSGAEGPNPFSSSIVMLILIVATFWLFSDDSNAGNAMVNSTSSMVTVSKAAVW